MADLAEVRWIGGGSGAGKSTVADLLATRFRLPVLHTDLSLRAHAASAVTLPRVAAFVAASMDERWVRRSPEQMLRTFPFFAGDAFDLLLDDIRALPARGPLIVEGFRLLPALVAPLAGPSRAVWLLPAPEARRWAMEERETGRRFWEATSDPPRALENLLERDRLFTERVRREVAALSLPSIDVDRSEPPDAVAARVAAVLDLAR